MTQSRFYGPDFDELEAADPDIAGLLLEELGRLRGGLQLIASENLTSPAVLAAQGSVLTNKYAEGYPGARYYGGCEVVDRAENLAIERAKTLFGAEHVNVQPHSGAHANLAVYAAFAQPGDTILAMSLPHGGHLTHGAKVNFSGRWFNTVPYHVRRDTELIDYDDLRELAMLHLPRIIVAGATAYSREIDFATFRSIADEVGAVLWVDAAHFIGLVAGGAIPSPVPYADVVSATTHKVLLGPRGGMLLCKQKHARAGIRTVSGGTDTHLALLDLQALGVDGRTAEARCAAAAITLNKNAIPFDPAPPAVASGIRVGSAAVTTQGFDAADMGAVGTLVARAVRADLDTSSGAAELAAVREEVATLVARKPAYPRA